MTAEMQLALGHTEDCELDDEQSRMRRSADAAHSRSLSGARPSPKKATGMPYVIQLEMETSAALGVLQTGRCVMCISALRWLVQGIRGLVLLVVGLARVSTIEHCRLSYRG
jgi:hypothetical protein